MVQRLIEKGKKLIKGFSAIEWIIAAVLLGIVFASVGKLMVTAIKNGVFVQKLTDTNTLITLKTNELFNDSKNQVAKIPKGQTQVGSIDPDKPVAGYFDLFNESGCLITSGTSKGETGSGTVGGTKGGIGSGAIGGTIDTGSTLDCSTSSFTNPSRSTFPRFRRQWSIVKDFPNPNDVTACVIVVYQDNNSIARMNFVTKSDGISSK